MAVDVLQSVRRYSIHANERRWRKRMGQILDMGIDAERAAQIAANAQQLGECTAMRGYVIQIKRGKAVRLTFDVMGENSCKVAAQHQALCEPGEYITVSPRRFGFTEDELVAADLEYLASQARRDRDRIRLLHEMELNELRDVRSAGL